MAAFIFAAMPEAKMITAACFNTIPCRDEEAGE
jgi:hypothetical protein